MRNTLQGKVVRGGRTAVAVGSGAVLLAGCSFGGLNSLDMPGTAGHGSGSYTITVELPDVATLPQNSPVMVDDVTVGSVSGIEAIQEPDGTFHAAVKLSLDGNVDLPENAMATVAQTSLSRTCHRGRCWVRSTSSSPGPPTGARVGCVKARRSRSIGRVATPPPKRCCPPSAWWSTRAISVRCRTSPRSCTPR